MAGFSDELEIEVLNYFFRAQALAPPPAGGAGLLYEVALYNVAGNPTDAGGGTENSDSGYSRASVTFAAPTGDPSLIDNTGIVVFGPATGAWTAVDAFSIFNDDASPDFLGWNTMTSRTLATDDRLEFAIGALDVTLD